MLGISKRSKTVHMYRNGDESFPAKSIVVNPNEVRNWDSFLDKVTKSTRLPGAAQIIYDAKTGKRVTSFDGLEDGKPYVAALKQRFKKRDYAHIEDPIKRGLTYVPQEPHVERIIKSGKATKIARGVRGLSIMVTMNGDLKFQPVRVLVNHRVVPDLIHLFEEISRKFSRQMPVPITKVFDLDGHKISSLAELRDNGQYVASGRRKFKPLPYFSVGPLSKSMPNPKSKQTKSSPHKLAPLHSSQKIANDSLSMTPPRKAVKASPSKLSKSTEAASPKKTVAAPVARKLKLSDDEKVQSYNVTVVTGDSDGDGTSANVYITLHGSKRSSERQALREDSDNFSSGAEDIFAIECPDLGELKSLTVEHDDAGVSSAWRLKRIAVRDTIKKKKVYFHFNDWLAADRGQMSCKATIPASNSPKAPQGTVAKDAFSAPTQQEADVVEDSHDTKVEREEAELKASEVDDEEDEDNQPTITSKKFKKEEKEFGDILQSAKRLKEIWRRIDYNGNNIVSLAEIDKFIGESYPKLNNKPALLRAYKKTTLKDGDMDAWVERFELPSLLRNLLYFNILWEAFDAIDTDDDRRVDFAEFRMGLKHLGIKLDKADAMGEFAAMDQNDGGMVLFDEFAAWAAQRKCPVNKSVMTEYTTTEDRPVD